MPESPARPHAKGRTLIWILVGLFLLGIVTFVPVGLATDRPEFCPTCHGMQPFYDAWEQGPHQDQWCIDCHVPPGIPARFAHKFVALKEVWAEVTTHATYPQNNAEVPDDRCLRCHEGLENKKVGKFDHAQHRSEGVGCATCHAATGHKVTYASLSSAGVLNTANTPAGTTYVGERFAGSGKASVLAGHKSVPCSNCHDQANLSCDFCHTPPKKHFGTGCKMCHKPNVEFDKAVFSHPSAGEHSYRSKPCAACHPSGTDRVYCTCHKGKPPTDD